MQQAIAVAVPSIEQPSTSARYAPQKTSDVNQASYKRWANLRDARYLGMALSLGGTLTLSILVAVAMVHFRETLFRMGNWGYLSVFAAEIGNSAAIVIPTPGPVITLAMASILNPLLVGLIGGIGAAVGELFGYMLGASGRRALEGSRIYDRFHALAQRRIGAALFVFAALPVPFDIAGIWAGTVRYSPQRFLLYVTAGKIIKITILAFASYYSFSRFLGSFG